MSTTARIAYIEALENIWRKGTRDDPLHSDVDHTPEQHSRSGCALEQTLTKVNSDPDQPQDPALCAPPLSLRKDG